MLAEVPRISSSCSDSWPPRRYSSRCSVMCLSMALMRGTSRSSITCMPVRAPLKTTAWRGSSVDQRLVLRSFSSQNSRRRCARSSALRSSTTLGRASGVALISCLRKSALLHSTTLSCDLRICLRQVSGRSDSSHASVRSMSPSASSSARPKVSAAWISCARKRSMVSMSATLTCSPMDASRSRCGDQRWLRYASAASALRRR